MIPLIDCPACKFAIDCEWQLQSPYIFHCSNKQCPIKFSERIQIVNEYDTNYVDKNDLKDGLLLYYAFEIDNYQVKIAPNMKSGPKIYIYCFDKNAIHSAPIIINQMFELEWLNSPNLSEKIKTWVTFS